MYTEYFPDGVSSIEAIIIIVTAALTSGLTAALGLGGGLALLAMMSAIFPASAVIPVHGVAQLGSNTGRALLQWRHVIWPVFAWFAAGGVLGTLLGGRLAVNIAPWILKAGVAAFIIISLWGPKISIPIPGPRTFFITGAVGAFLTLFFGATGPIAATVLSRAGFTRFSTVATHGACMVFQHLLKVLTFGVFGFAYADWAVLILLILSSGFIGTWVGIRFLKRLPEKTFKTGFQWVLSLIAVSLLLGAVQDFMAA